MSLSPVAGLVSGLRVILLIRNVKQNWPITTKVKIVGVLCLAVFSGFVAPLAGQLNVVSQSKLYAVSTTQIAYQVLSQEGSISTLRLQLTLCRILPLLPAWLPEAFSLRLSPTSWVEARSSSGP